MEEKLKYIVRIASTDLAGDKPISHTLTRIKGVNFSMANAICYVNKLDKNKKTGSLKEQEIKKIEEIIKEPKKHNIPSWLLNRQKDYDSGEDLHLTVSDLKLRKDFDIKRLRKIKSYRGFRHGSGLPVRGQRTKSNFRKGKSLGVKRKKK
ncbi:30S ribosomal protein S13 [Candidatus Woesearchaeota archaeon]|jgi:small subunit ribosomal protein S13|nr:30S ribosomal protein S13 [Candidatus Woesearchaeota archaeon]MBT4321805.1 30S ribosomal protein S13 [Candidatus Woesearchaeota archaeon]MBT4630813.1 30S ribosomal protein S13 [Candidatus Woesearchaeota archaeon]